MVRFRIKVKCFVVTGGHKGVPWVGLGFDANLFCGSVCANCRVNGDEGWG